MSFLIEVHVLEVDDDTKDATMCDGWTLGRQFKEEPSARELAEILETFYTGV